MAAALFNRYADAAKARAISAGTAPGERVRLNSLSICQIGCPGCSQRHTIRLRLKPIPTTALNRCLGDWFAHLIES
jgi:hypothetical protein